MPCPQPALGSCLPISCCIGGAPWCSATPPAPSSGSRGVISHPLPTAADRPQGCALAPGKGFSPHWATGQPPQTPCMHLRVLTPLPWGGHPADSQTPPATSPTGWHPPGSGSHLCLTTPCSPLLLAKGPIPIDWPWGGRKDPPAIPTPPVLLRLPAVTAEGVWCEMKRQNQTRYMQYLSVCTCKV